MFSFLSLQIFWIADVSRFEFLSPKAVKGNHNSWHFSSYARKIEVDLACISTSPRPPGASGALHSLRERTGVSAYVSTAYFYMPLLCKEICLEHNWYLV